MKKFFLYTTFCLLLCLVFSCNGNSTASSLEGGDTIPLQYAKNITMVRYDDCIKVELVNPWGKGLLGTYFLIQDPLCPDGHIPHNGESHPDGSSLGNSQDGLPPHYGGGQERGSSGQQVTIPLKNALVFTAVHCGLICELGMEDCIGGVCERQYIHCLTKEVLDCGNGMSPNQERIIQLHPDAMLVSPFESNTGHDKLGQLGIPVIECAEYMEPTALGRAEWMKFYGLLVGKEAEANALFDALVARYDSLRALTAHVSTTPRIISETLYGNVWYQPGVNSPIGQVYADAGAMTAFPQYTQSGSVPLSAEQVYAQAHDAEVWLVRYSDRESKTLAQLGAEADVYSRFDAFRRHNVWGCNVETSYFYERSPFHPDRLLSDVIQICHPELHLQEPMHYYEKLK